MHFLNPSWRRWVEKVKKLLNKTIAALAAAPKQRSASQQDQFRDDFISEKRLKLSRRRAYNNTKVMHGVDTSKWACLILSLGLRYLWKAELLYYLHAGWWKKRCIFRFPRQPLGRIVACADWLTRPASQTDNQLEAATRGTKNALPPVENSQNTAVYLKWFNFFILVKPLVQIFNNMLKNEIVICFSHMIKR